MYTFSLAAEQAEDLHGRFAGGAEPMWQSGVELGGLTWSQDQVVIGHDEPQTPGEHVQPLIALVGAGLGPVLFGWDDRLPCLQGSRMGGQGDHRAAVADAGFEADTWVADLWCPDQLIQRELTGLGDGQQEFQAGAALARLQSRQGALGDVFIGEGRRWRVGSGR